MFFGVTTRVNPNNGLLMKNMHDNREENRIGKILKTVWSKTKRKVRFVAEVFNTERHPNLIKKLKNGFGVSIGGYVIRAIRSFDKLSRRLVMKIKNLVVEHIQIVPPSVVTGQSEAKVEDVQIQECMVFRRVNGNKLLTLAEISAIVLNEIGDLP